jgi:hypothetical protein
LTGLCRAPVLCRRYDNALDKDFNIVKLYHLVFFNLMLSQPNGILSDGHDHGLANPWDCEPCGQIGRASQRPGDKYTREQMVDGADGASS